MKPGCASRRVLASSPLEPLGHSAAQAAGQGKVRLWCLLSSLTEPHQDSALCPRRVGAAALPLSLCGWARRTRTVCRQKPVVQGSAFCCALHQCNPWRSVLIPAPSLSFLGGPRNEQGRAQPRSPNSRLPEGPCEVESEVPDSQVRKLKPRMGAF